MNRKLIILISGLILLVINLILSAHLPNEIGMQMSFNGHLNNFIPKSIFIFIFPVLLIGDYAYTVYDKEMKLTKPFVVGAIFFVLNFVTIIFNK